VVGVVMIMAGIFLVAFAKWRAQKMSGTMFNRLQEDEDMERKSEHPENIEMELSATKSSSEHLSIDMMSPADDGSITV
jgi:hypothetical protein